MSTVVLDTITGKSTATTITIGSTPVVSASANSMTIRGEGSNQTSIQQGLAKCWVNFNGTGTIAARDSFNVSSLTDSGTGKYDINYSNNMGNTSYIVATFSNSLDGNDDGNQKIAGERKSNSRSTSMTPIHSGDWFYASSATFADATQVYNSTHGDLA